MPFSDSVRREALVRSHRRCCVCHEGAGRDVVLHHIIPEADGGPDTVDNAIVLCPYCHSEAGHYNPRHPLGTKYSRKELRRHRDQWWAQCAERPEEAFRGPRSRSPLPASQREQVQSLITFLEDRRVLYNPYLMERDEWVIKSVLTIRARLTELLEVI